MELTRERIIETLQQEQDLTADRFIATQTPGGSVYREDAGTPCLVCAIGSIIRHAFTNEAPYVTLQRCLGVAAYGLGSNPTLARATNLAARGHYLSALSVYYESQVNHLLEQDLLVMLRERLVGNDSLALLKQRLADFIRLYFPETLTLDDALPS